MGALRLSSNTDWREFAELTEAKKREHLAVSRSEGTMNSSSQKSLTTSSETGRDPPRRRGAEPSGAHPSQTDELTQDLIGCMKRLARDERRRKKIAKKLF